MNSSQRAFVKILLSYFSVLAIPVIAGLAIYHSAFNSITGLIRDNAHNMLKQSISITDVRLQELESLPFYLGTHSDFVSFLNQNQISEGSSEVFSVYQAYSNMPKFSLVNSIIDDIQVISLMNEFVVSQSNALRLTSQTHDALFKYTGMDYPSFQSYLHDNPFDNSFVLFRDETGSKTPALLSNIRYPASSQPLAVVIIRLKESSLQNILEELLPQQDGIVFILDENNEMITSLSGQSCTLSLEEAAAYVQHAALSDSDYDNYIVSMLESSYNGWKYCIFSPRSTVMRNMFSINQRILLFIGLTLCVSILFTYFLVRQKAASLKKVILYLNGQALDTSPHDEYAYIADTATKLISSNRQLQKTLQLQKPLLDAAALRNLLTGAVNKPQELRYLFQYLDIKPDHQYFAVMLVTLAATPGQEEYSQYPILPSALVRELIEKNAIFHTFCLDIDSTQKAVVFIGEEINEEDFKQQLHRFAHKLIRDAEEKNALSLTCYLSDTHRMVDELPAAYSQTLVISQQAARHMDCALYTTADIPSIQRFYYYPLQAELELLRLIKNGSKGELSLMLEKLKHANFTERSLSPSMTRQLLFAVYSSILRGMEELPAEKYPDGLLSGLKTPSSFEELAAGILQLNEYFVQKSTQQNAEKLQKQAREILLFINEHYTDCNFSIYQICDHFHISESSAYQLFREVIGTSFTGLVEHMRIEYACQLLSDKKLLIKDISSAVGYTNDNSFRRAFKRAMGITPGEYMGVNTAES